MPFVSASTCLSCPQLILRRTQVSTSLNLSCLLRLSLQLQPQHTHTPAARPTYTQGSAAGLFPLKVASPIISPPLTSPDVANIVGIFHKSIKGIKLTFSQREIRSLLGFYCCVICHACRTLQNQTALFLPLQTPSANMFLCSSLTAFASLSSPCSESGFVAYFSPQRVATCNSISTSLMSHLLVCSHNLSPCSLCQQVWNMVPYPRPSGSWEDNCCLCSDGETPLLLLISHPSSPPADFSKGLLSQIPT